VAAALHLRLGVLSGGTGFFRTNEVTAVRRPAHPRHLHPTGHTIELRDERGTAMVEYSLVLALVAVVAFGLVGAVGQETLDIYTRIGNAIHAFFV
jgi:Flp pilus assembly pilin Flp